MIQIRFLLLSLFCVVANAAIANMFKMQQQIDAYLAQGQYDSAKVYIETQLNDVNQVVYVSELNYQLVKILFIQSNYNDALKQAFNSLDNVEDDAQSVKFNFMIGCIYSAITDYSKSIEYLELVAVHSQDSSLTVKTHLLLSGLHLDAGDTAKAISSIVAAHEITSVSNLNSKIRSHVAVQYNFFSENYELCKQQNEEIIADTNSFLNAKSYAYAMIGDCLIQQDSLVKAASYYEEFLQLTFETKDPEQIKVAANKLISVYEKIGNQGKANAYHKIYNEAEKDTSSFSAEKYRDLYDIEKNRELSIEKNKSLRNYGLLVFGFFVIISLGVYIYFNRIRKFAAEKLMKGPSKKIVINDDEIAKMKTAIQQLTDKQLFLTPNITRKSFCAESGLTSERYISQFINEEYKKSFSVFINDLRIEYAYTRIQNDSTFRRYKIEEIAKDCGFGSKKSFERAFLAKYDQTPFKFISSLDD